MLLFLIWCCLFTWRISFSVLFPFCPLSHYGSHDSFYFAVQVEYRIKIHWHRRQREDDDDDDDTDGKRQLPTAVHARWMAIRLKQVFFKCSFVCLVRSHTGTQSGFHKMCRCNSCLARARAHTYRRNAILNFVRILFHITFVANGNDNRQRKQHKKRDSTINKQKWILWMNLICYLFFSYCLCSLLLATT